MMVTSGFSTVPYAVVAGISASMEPSAALLEQLTVHSSCEQVQTTIFTVTATLKVTAITFKKERCEWDSGLESALQATSLLTPILVGIQGIVSSLRKYQKLSSKQESCDHLDFETKTLDLCYDVMRFLKQLLFSSLCQLKNKVQKNPLLFWFILASSRGGGEGVSKKICGTVRLPVWRHVSRQRLSNWRAKYSSKRWIKLSILSRKYCSDFLNLEILRFLLSKKTRLKYFFEMKCPVV